ncbi:uncharacterized protein BYT42DRAFT_393049 [Radiomyces spectabilis]|uniref:uncharacterized protein n=1 Tax=Radiomyces spectabilis TaxID=64574 RepID=UPI0022209FAE|nr:uncharacterized protein BYT42DRAFT_393049 [Radiomyces spectabilis]KAI8374158.1 hypothetical protein BYT42DRAFT_393049 [Radiomyces spectabilis]
MDTGTFVKYEKCSETAKNHAESVNLYVSIDDHVTVDPLLLPGTLDYTDLIQRRMNGMTVTCKDQFNWIINGRRVNIVVEAINGVQAVTQFVINRSSQITVQYHTHFSKEGALEEKDELVDTLTEAIKSAFENLEAFAALRMPVAKSILLHGVAGAGKKTLISTESVAMSAPSYILV